MGILDDAIRQHLDLKRRQGAEDDELQRLEDEAFGPPSRPGDPDFPEPASEAEGQAAEVATGTGVAAPEGPEPFADEAELFADPAPEAPSVPASEQLEPESAEQPIEPESADQPIEPESAEQPVAEPPIESLDTVEHHFEGAIGETGETSPVEDAEPEEAEVVEGELADEEGEADEEDVLEETPEFLRDQPEDDELWFEQGEPKDFDF